ncbi:MAG: protein phosphatase 2C domain-containing protein [Planctomycetales bacterium]|nr:protein phosphatase 2C domain-containing protein [Planctomycetales bacterium]
MGDSNHVQMLFDANWPQPQLFEFAGGHAAVFSHRSPDKETPNEDSVALLSAGDTSGIIAVADGCGGMALGEVASRSAILALEETLIGAGVEGPALRPVVLDGLELANQRVCEVGGGAATTIAVVEIDGTMIRTYHAGDSSILQISNRGRIKMQTVAHSPVGYAIEAGVLDATEAIYHEDRHLVSNVLGMVDAHIEVGARRKMNQLDTLIIGSDGLFDNLHVEEIVDLARKGSLLKCANQLATLATQRMQEISLERPCKPDDLSFVLFRCR